MTAFMGFIELLSTRRSELITALGEHVLLVVVAVGVATLVAVPLGVAITRVRRLEVPILGIASVLQTIPSLALLAFMLVLGLGLGFRSAAIALFLYSLLPVLRNTYAGIEGVDPALKRAAVGMGMTDRQVLTMIELPLAVPMIMAGIRTATVVIIGTAVLAAYIGYGGLGVFIMRGLGLQRDSLILLGAIPSAVLALMAEFVLGRVERWVTPKGLRV